MHLAHYRFHDDALYKSTCLLTYFICLCFCARRDSSRYATASAYNCVRCWESWRDGLTRQSDCVVRTTSQWRESMKYDSWPYKNPFTSRHGILQTSSKPWRHYLPARNISFIHSFITICRAHYVENFESRRFIYLIRIECIMIYTHAHKHSKQEVKVIWQKAPHGGPISRLGVTPGGRKLYHWIPGVGFPISVP